MPLSEIQKPFVAGVVRPQMETIIRNLHELSVFVDDYDALQATVNALPEDDTVLDDEVAGGPTLTGLNVKQLRDFSNNMSAVVTPAAKQILISLMTRDLATVLKLS